MWKILIALAVALCLCVYVALKVVGMCAQALVRAYS